jgi:hypothetical protein
VIGNWDRMGLGSPTAALPATAFVPVDGPSVLVEVSPEGRIVTLDAALVRNESGAVEREERTVYGRVQPQFEDPWFLLDVGIGGRFIVQEQSGALFAEYAMSGSGVPIVFATRGRLDTAP